MSEPIIVIIIKKYLWEFVAGAVCLTMVHQFIENNVTTANWVKPAKAMVNSLYASIFFAVLGGYFYGEIGLVMGILIGSAVGFGSVVSLSEFFINKAKNK